jgi:hypothetical protein
MIKHQIDEIELEPYPGNQNWTNPRSYGVWKLPLVSTGRKYRYGNNPIRGIELTREFGNVQRIALYSNRDAARDHAKKLNDG